MNLKWHLLYRITLVGLLSLLICAAYLLYQTDQRARLHNQELADSLSKQLEFQLLRINAGIGQPNPFPDFELWKLSNASSGVCINFKSAEGATAHSLCTGEKLTGPTAPPSFAQLYTMLFTPGAVTSRPVNFKDRHIGLVSITASPNLEISQAWQYLQALFGLSTLTIALVCILVYLSINQALQPATIIVAGLHKMQTGQLHWRLPPFKINEWQQTGLAINQLASSQQLLLDQQRRLSVQLMTLQEDERRFLSRELHDEIGQCLTAINAITTAIAQTADQQYPELTDDLLSIKRITRHMQQAVHDLLSRLRPAEMEELGLAASLGSLIRNWQNQKPAITDYQLTINGDCRKLSTTQAMALFRIAQECLTNINRHAQASRVIIELSIAANDVCLQVMDDGLANSLPFANQSGLGLLGIRERLTALQGTLQLEITEPHGLTVKAFLPLAQTTTLL